MSCKEKKADMGSNETESHEIPSDDWPKKKGIDPKAQMQLNDWAEYQTLETNFDALYTVANREDLSLVIENMIEAQKNLAKSKYPEPFDTPRVKSRQKVFTTYMLKVKGDLYYRIDPKESILQMISAYNAFRNQFNIIIKNTLDTKLILEE
ncbi:hypothetical protein [Pareuzebyella sediminis]|uniref:hypothetical protein n=1 Tax=Pareuzebyella sediminis TaxID=2607998 RepID=UPI0011EBC700|nr:hypothetical protein [Pareuzebyella sediminis]